ncbi:NAD(P)-binding protein, partial [Polyplosphaeria fusca]
MSVFKAGATALITGGSSGVGLAVAHLCLKHGMRTAIVDINPATLELARENLGGDVETYQADVSNEADWQRVKDAVGTRFGEVDFLMLNAGVGTKSTWGDADYFQKVFSTNLFGVIHGLNAFVPAFKARSTPGTIVITGSKRGITNSPGNPAYNASKAAVKTLAEHLSFDLRDTSTSVHLLMPGSTFTGLVSYVRACMSFYLSCGTKERSQSISAPVPRPLCLPSTCSLLVDHLPST